MTAHPAHANTTNRTAGTTTTPGADMLTDTQKAVLDFAGRTYRYPGARETDIRDTFDISPIRYEQILNALIDTEDALAHAPQTVKRLRRLRELRKAVRV